MNAKMLKALEDCIEKRWNLIAAGCDYSKLPTCHLCVNSGENCERCPIDDKTKQGCKGTPFWKCVGSKYYNSSKYWDAVEEEIEFLISILPKNHRLKKQ